MCKSCLGHLKTCKSIENGKSTIFANPTFLLMHIEESKKEANNKIFFSAPFLSFFCLFFSLSSIHIRRKLWICENFRNPVFDGFTYLCLKRDLPIFRKCLSVFMSPKYCGHCISRTDARKLMKLYIQLHLYIIWCISLKKFRCCLNFFISLKQWYGRKLRAVVPNTNYFLANHFEF